MKTSTLRRTGSILAATVVLAAALPAATFAADPPPTLQGEFLSAYPDAIPSSTVDILATCDPTGTSTISWSVSGDAFGPYPGTFIETGTASVGPQTAPAYVNGMQLGNLVSVEAFFAIDSPVGQVNGSKRMTATTSSDLGGCRELQDFVLPDATLATGSFRRVNVASLVYEAVVIAADAVYLDAGTSGLLLEQFNGTGMTEIAAVQEAFVSGQSGLVAATGGRATGGGRVGDVSFGFTAAGDRSAAKGRCAVVDAPSDIIVRCTDATSVYVIGSRAIISGNAQVNGSAVRYRLEVEDRDEAGAGSDTWSIRLSNGYEAGGTLTEGNVQVHG